MICFVIPILSPLLFIQSLYSLSELLCVCFFLQDAILSVLKEASRLNPDLLRNKVEDVKHNHREDRSEYSSKKVLNSFAVSVL